MAFELMIPTYYGEQITDQQGRFHIPANFQRLFSTIAYLKKEMIQDNTFYLLLSETHLDKYQKAHQQNIPSPFDPNFSLETILDQVPTTIIKGKKVDQKSRINLGSENLINQPVCVFGLKDFLMLYVGTEEQYKKRFPNKESNPKVTF